MATTVLRNTVNKRLAAAGASWTMPTTRAGIDKRLEDIAAGKGLRKPTAAHPYAACFTPNLIHYHRGSRVFRGSGYNDPKRYDDIYGPALSCVEHIRQCEAEKLEARATA